MIVLYRTTVLLVKVFLWANESESVPEYVGFQVRLRVLNRYENSLLYMILQPLTSNLICSVLIQSVRLWA